MDCGLPASSVCGVSQQRILEWVAIFCNRGPAQPRGQACISCTGRWILYHLGSPRVSYWWNKKGYNYWQGKVKFHRLVPSM